MTFCVPSFWRRVEMKFSSVTTNWLLPRAIFPTIHAQEFTATINDRLSFVTAASVQLLRVRQWIWFGEITFHRKDFEKYGEFLETPILAVTFSRLLRDVMCTVYRIIFSFLLFAYHRTNPLFDTVYTFRDNIFTEQIFHNNMIK